MHSCKNITQWTKPLLQSFKTEKNFYYDSLSVIVTLNIPAKIDLIQFILKFQTIHQSKLDAVLVNLCPLSTTADAQLKRPLLYSEGWGEG